MPNRYQCSFVPNPWCKGGCNREDRQKVADSDICNIATSVTDSLPVRCVGEWAEQKIYLLSQYFGIFAQGMSNKWKGKINYIEICSGPGKCINRNGRTEFDGTALSIVSRPEFRFVNKALFFDISSRVVDTLNQRLSVLSVSNAKAYLGDYTNPETICSVLRAELAFDSLNLVVIDPTDCSIPFESIKKIKRTLPRMDMIINVAVGTDYNRNIRNTLLQPDQFKRTAKKYCSFLGDSNFYDKIRKTDSDQSLRAAFISAYVDSLKSIGFSFFANKAVENYYHILFASQSNRGIDFWKKATKYDYVGQGTLF